MEGFNPVGGRDSSAIRARQIADLIIGVDECQAQSFGDSPPNGGLSRGHGTDDDDVVG